MQMTYDSTGLEPTAGFPLIPDGKYNLVVREVFDTDANGNQRKTQAGDSYVSVLCEVDDKEYLGSTVFHNVTFMPKEKKGAGMAIHFLKCIGESYKDKFTINTDNWIGKRFQAQIGSDTYKGKTKNIIAYLIDPEETPADDVPF